jgi:hypothetical protein
MVWIILRLSVAAGGRAASLAAMARGRSRSVMVRVAALDDCLAAAKRLVEPHAADAQVGALNLNPRGFAGLQHGRGDRARHLGDRDDVALLEPARLGVAGAQNARRLARVIGASAITTLTW